ncbi:MAG: TauD/TfdA family dioxygenase [Actinobacteria bacterium]|nr:MAG: TauD/TfdA family dioxygenase [Actinomycetota bacterium]
MTTTTETSVQLTVVPVAGRIGAEIQGVDASADLSEDTVAAIRCALVKHRVGFLRDQRLDYEAQVRFARRFGDLTLGHPTLTSPPDRPHLEEIDSGAGVRTNFWHTDVTFVDRPPAFTMLRAVVIPELGGDTIWANTVSAYHDLSPELRELADKLRIVHTNTQGYSSVVESADEKSETVAAHRREFVSTVYQTEHPAVRVHPESGERSLMLGGWAQKVVGLSAQSSRDLLGLLQDFVIRPENTVRWRWRVGDLAIWDNRATQHYAIHDYGDAHRRGERVTVAGPVPVGVDGRPSVALRGDASAYYAGETQL